MAKASRGRGAGSRMAARSGSRKLLRLCRFELVRPLFSFQKCLERKPFRFNAFATKSRKAAFSLQRKRDESVCGSWEGAGGSCWLLRFANVRRVGCGRARWARRREAPAILGGGRRLRWAVRDESVCDSRRGAGQPAGGSREGRRRAVGAILPIVSLCAAWASAASAARGSRVWPLSAAGELRLPGGLPGDDSCAVFRQHFTPASSFTFAGVVAAGRLGLQ